MNIYCISILYSLIILLFFIHNLKIIFTHTLTTYLGKTMKNKMEKHLQQYY